MSIKTDRLEDLAEKSFDFIIIGGGTAGCVLARRLTDEGNFTVAVLEAGRAHGDDPKILGPHGWMTQILDTDYDWKFYTVPQKHAKGKRCDWSRGKGLGGSSCINLMAWTRPARQEMDAFERLGNKGWNWDNFVKYSRKAERFCPSDPEFEVEFQELYDKQSVGHDGPIPISFVRTGTNAEAPFQKTLEKHGIPVIGDYLNGNICGSFKGMSDVNPVDGTRVSAATGYLYPALGRPNLKVLTEARVDKILTDKVDGELVARGVQFTYGGKQYSVWAKREVLLCAGALKSPQVLELSGIGDPAILKPLGIPVQLDLPSVGTNMQDHQVFPAPIFKMVEDKSILGSTMLEDAVLVNRLREMNPKLKVPWLITLQGITFTSIQATTEKAAAIIAARRKVIETNAHTYPPGLLEQYKIQLEHLENKDTPDFEIMIFPFIFGDVPRPPDPDKPYIAVLCELGHPFARGTIHIGSNDPDDAPLMDPQYFNNDTDGDILLEGFRFIRRVCETEPFKSLVEAEVAPGPGMQTDEEIKEFMREQVHTAWHTCGSTSMLPRDKGGVVDTSLKVYGTRNLRVIDLGIVPLMVSVHTQAVVYGIAEQAAEIIKATHKAA